MFDFFMLRTCGFKFFFNGMLLLFPPPLSVLSVSNEPFPFLAPLRRTSSWSFDEKLLIQSLYRVITDAFLCYIVFLAVNNMLPCIFS